jgi:hypothetical protein
MNAPLTIAEVRSAVVAGRIDAAEFLRERWQQLYRSNQGEHDSAWISIATASQLESQLADLEATLDEVKAHEKETRSLLTKASKTVPVV